MLHLVEYGTVLKQDSWPFRSTLEWDGATKGLKLKVSITGVKGVYSRIVDGTDIGTEQYASTFERLFAITSEPTWMSVECKVKVIEQDDTCRKTPRYLYLRDAVQTRTSRGTLYTFPEVAVEIWKGTRDIHHPTPCKDACHGNTCTLAACFTIEKVDALRVRIASGKARLGSDGPGCKSHCSHEGCEEDAMICYGKRMEHENSMFLDPGSWDSSGDMIITNFDLRKPLPVTLLSETCPENMHEVGGFSILDELEIY